ncbi:MAG: acyltransferase [Chloroflexi bacterium]|nr:acyltransferase [Chloroflexota bacterium]
MDGIRGLAVAAVLAYHAGLPWARGGFLGVDAFFVLSGFLITSLLLTERQATGAINLGTFWARRARRLLPALFLLLVGVMGYAVVFAEQEELTALRHDAIATIAYVANWRFVFSGESYFQQFVVPSPLRHTWSLAIEEQWYLFWPVLVLALLRWRRGSVATLLGLSLALAAASALLMAWLFDPQGDPSRVYYGTDTRAQSLLVGAALAAWLIRYRPDFAGKTQLLQAAALACAAFIGWAWIVTPENSQLLYRGGFLLLALAVAVVIVAAVAPKGGILTNVLSFAPLRGLGLISYGVYLWHWPVYLVLTPERIGWDGHQLFAVRVLATLAIAIASYRIVEMPFRRGGLWRWRASWVLAPASAAVLVIGIVLVTRVGEPTFALPTASSSIPPPTVAAPISAGSASCFSSTWRSVSPRINSTTR